MNDWRDWVILGLSALLVIGFGFWSLRERYVHNPTRQYDSYTSDELSWVIEGRMEALYDDFEDLIKAIVCQKQLLNE